MSLVPSDQDTASHASHPLLTPNPPSVPGGGSISVKSQIIFEALQAIYSLCHIFFLSLFFFSHSSSVQFSSVAQSCPTLYDPMNCSTPRLPVHHQLLEFTQTHVHRVGDAIQPSHPLSSPSPPAPNPSQHQSLFQ